MSVNDELPWIGPMLHLIRHAVDADVPLLGHCLGGQLISKAMGGVVSRNAVKEIGWGDVSVADSTEAQRWFGHATPSFTSFHWHGETFTLPAGASRVLTNQYCVNQAFSFGKHLGMQCHVEMTPEMIASWIRSGAGEVKESLASPAVQPVEKIQEEMPRKLPDLSATAERLYRRWVKGLKAWSSSARKRVPSIGLSLYAAVSRKPSDSYMRCAALICGSVSSLSVS